MYQFLYGGNSSKHSHFFDDFLQPGQGRFSKPGEVEVTSEPSTEVGESMQESLANFTEANREPIGSR